MAYGDFEVTSVTSPAGAQAPATQLVEANQGSVLLFNEDPINTVYLGSKNSILANDNTGIAPLGPKSSLAVDGSANVFAAISAGLSANVAAYPSGVAFTNPVGITSLAQLGSFSGTPAGTVGSGSPMTVLNLVDVSGYTSYDLNLWLTALSPGGFEAVVVGEIQLQWFDDTVSGIPVFEEDWWFWAARAAPVAANGNGLAGCGPMHGRYMTVTVQVPFASAFNATLQYINIFGSNRTVPYSDWRQNVNSVQPECDGLAYLGGSGTSFDNVLARCDVSSVGASSSYWIPMGLYSGPVYFHMRFSGAQLAAPVIVNCEQLVGGGLSVGTACPGQLVAEAGAANTDYYGTILLPRAPCALVSEGPAAASTVTFQVIAQQAA
jgi:hypothetical protein